MNNGGATKIQEVHSGDVAEPIGFCPIATTNSSPLASAPNAAKPLRRRACAAARGLHSCVGGASMLSISRWLPASCSALGEGINLTFGYGGSRSSAWQVGRRRIRGHRMS